MLSGRRASRLAVAFNWDRRKLLVNGCGVDWEGLQLNKVVVVYVCFHLVGNGGKFREDTDKT